MFDVANNIVEDYAHLIEICNNDEVGMLEAYDSIKRAIRLVPVALRIEGDACLTVDSTLTIDDNEFQVKEFLSCYGENDDTITKLELSDQWYIPAFGLTGTLIHKLKIEDNSLPVNIHGGSLRLFLRDDYVPALDKDHILEARLYKTKGYVISFATKPEITMCENSYGKYHIRANELFLEQYNGVVLAYLYPKLVWNNVIDDLLAMFTIMRYKEIDCLRNGDIKGSSTYNYMLSGMINLYNSQVDTQCGIDIVENKYGL